MPDDKIENGDTRLILHRLDQVSDQIVEVKTDLSEVKTKQEDFHEANLKSRAEIEKQTALLQQSQETISKTVDKNAKKIEKNDLWTKIIGALTGVLILAATVLGIVNQLMSQTR